MGAHSISGTCLKLHSIVWNSSLFLPCKCLVQRKLIFFIQVRHQGCSPWRKTNNLFFLVSRMNEWGFVVCWNPRPQSYYGDWLPCHGDAWCQGHGKLMEFQKGIFAEINWKKQNALPHMYSPSYRLGMKGQTMMPASSLQMKGVEQKSIQQPQDGTPYLLWGNYVECLLSQGLQQHWWQEHEAVENKRLIEKVQSLTQATKESEGRGGWAECQWHNHVQYTQSNCWNHLVHHRANRVWSPPSLDRLQQS